MKEFEDLELAIHRSQKWLEPHEKRGFFLSSTLSLQNFKLPKELSYLTEERTPQLRAIIKRHWETFIVNLMKELRQHPISVNRGKTK